MNERIKIEKNRYSDSYKCVLKENFITTDGRHHPEIEDAERHQKEIDTIENKRKEYQDFLSTFNVERKPCPESVVIIISEYPIYEREEWDIKECFFDIFNKESSCQWFNIKTQEDRDKIKEYYDLFFCYTLPILKYHSGWTLIIIWEDKYDMGEKGEDIYSLVRYKDYIKTLTDNLPC